MVTLAEDLYLLASDATSGRLLIDALHLDFGLGGAFLVDLAQRDRIALVDEHVTFVDGAPTGEPLLDSALAAIGCPSRAHGPDHWIRHLGRGAHQAVQERLVNIGVLRRDEDRILRVVPVHRTHETDGRRHHQLVDHLHDAVVLDRPPRPRPPRWRHWPSPYGSTGTCSRCRTGGRSGLACERSRPTAPTARG